ncbi:MAG: ATPase domain-containing protein [Bryobacteraceae bacterium]
MTEQERQRAILLKLTGLEGGAQRRPPGIIPTGLAPLDRALGTGGLPLGAISEIFGSSGSGKTTLALQMVRRAQSSGGAAAWIDVDRTFDPAYAASLGVAPDRLVVVMPESAEEAFEMAARLAASQAVSLLIVDPAAALAPAVELDAAIGTSGPGLHGRVLASGLQKLAVSTARTGVALVFLNQTRSRMEAGAEADTSAGGASLKLYAAVRIALEPAGAGLVRFRVLKNTAGEGHGRGELRWIPGAGFAETA